MSNSPDPVAALNGRLVPLAEAYVSIVDDGLVQGATVTERVRTFRHQPFRLPEHLDRLRQSLAMTGVAPVDVVETLPPLIDRVVAVNSGLIADWQDLSIVIFITPGPNASMDAISVPPGPTSCVHTIPLPAPQWATHATEGLRLVTPSVRQVPGDVIDPHIKHRSRLHWFLADREVKQTDPHAFALLLDAQGYVTETSTGNFLAFDGERLLTPRRDRVLGGISQRVVTELAGAAGIETVEADLTPADVLCGREAFLSSTGYCLLPVTRLNGRAIGEGRPGPLYRQLVADWSASVGVDIPGQFQRACEAPDQ